MRPHYAANITATIFLCTAGFQNREKGFAGVAKRKHFTIRNFGNHELACVGISVRANIAAAGTDALK
jgi:hypothetical protein